MHVGQGLQPILTPKTAKSRRQKVFFHHPRHRMPLAGLHLHQERVLRLCQIKPLAQVCLNARQQRGGYFGIGQRAVRPASAGQAVKRGHCA